MAIKTNNETIQKYMPLVKSIARKLSNKLPKHYDIEDLVSDGVVGLLAATERFDPERGVKFETFATYYVKGSILDNLPKLPVIKNKKSKKKLEAAKAEKSNTENDTNHLFKKMNQITYSYILSLDAPAGGDSEDGYSLLGQVGQSDHIERDMEFEELQGTLRLAIEQLPTQERTTLKYYYFHKIPFNEIGKRLGLSESWVSRIHKRALEQLRGKMGKSKYIDDFLSKL